MSFPERVFNEQFVIDTDSGPGDGSITARPRSAMTSRSVQSPYDPECSYRKKAGDQVKGYSVNVTETIGEDQLNLLTDIQLKPAHWGDANFVEPAITNTREITNDEVETCYADGAYNRSLEHEDKDQDKNKDNDKDELGGVEMVLSGIQGAPSRFDLHQTDDGLEVRDTQTGRVHQARPVRRRDQKAPPKWRIILDNGSYRYFGPREIRASKQRRLLAEKGYRERARRRNNVEATIYHLSHRLKGAKTVYRGLVRNKIWAWGRALWVNMRRIQRYIDHSASSEAQYTI